MVPFAAFSKHSELPSKFVETHNAVCAEFYSSVFHTPDMIQVLSQGSVNCQRWPNNNHVPVSLTFDSFKKKFLRDLC